MLQQTGSSGTTYGFTGEQYDASTDMLYLRARYYNPAIQSFMSRDPWEGNISQPQTLNGWNYVENNPTNLVDPTGLMSTAHDREFRADYCKSVWTPNEYGRCVRKEYGRGSFLHFDNPDVGFPFQGNPNCWYGPVPYRARGYIEGSNNTVVAGLGFTNGLEVVYDFASMQRQNFKYAGVIVQDSFSVSTGQYAGLIFGMRTLRYGWDTFDITVDYSGPFVSGSVGVGAGVALGIEIGPSVGGGLTFFASPTDPSIRGFALYLSVSLGIDPVPIFDFSGTVTNYTSISQVIDYREQGPYGGRTFVNVERIGRDIRNGVESPWVDKFPNLQSGGYSRLQYKMIREQMVLIRTLPKFVDIFNQIHFASYSE